MNNVMLTIFNSWAIFFDRKSNAIQFLQNAIRIDVILCACIQRQMSTG